MSGAVYPVYVVSFAVDTLLTQDVVPLARAAVGGLGVSAAFLWLVLASLGQLGLGEVMVVSWIGGTLAWLG
jgi:hypothetical protein